jgi:beta-glucanase (GH16 family)
MINRIDLSEVVCEMKNALVGFLAVALVILTVPVAYAASTEPSNSCELRPVMIEDFNEDTAPNRRIESISAHRLGPARWTAHTPWNGDFGDAVFLDPEPEHPFKIKDGILAITASKDQQGKWTSGLIAAADARGVGFGTRYGYFEARMKMPAGPGTWPAFWLAALKPVAGSDGNVEIDVIEYYGQFTSSYQAVLHVWYKDQAKSRGQNLKVDVPDNSLVDDYHTFGVDLSPQAIVFFRDGKQVWSQPTPPELDGPMYPLVNLALGSGWPIDRTPNPSTLLVDYVHVYGRDAGPPEGCPPGPRPASR